MTYNSPIVSGEESDELPGELFVAPSGDKKELDVVAVDDKEDYYNFF